MSNENEIISEVIFSKNGKVEPRLYFYRMGKIYFRDFLLLDNIKDLSESHDLKIKVHNSYLDCYKDFMWLLKRQGRTLIKENFLNIKIGD